jgi:L-rhamnose isomerase/sugar isomerase
VNIKPKIESMIQSVVNVQEAYARALLVDRKTLLNAQMAGDVVTAEETVMAAYRTDVRPLLAALREEMGLAPDPLAAYRASGYYQKVCAERAGMATGGYGFQGA